MQTFEKIDIQEIPLSSPIFRRKVEAFLAANGLRFEEVDSYYVLQDGEGEIVAGAGLHKDVIKCVAVDSHVRSGGLMVPLVSHVINHAAAQGITNLKVFTKPENESIFVSLGFHLISRAPKAILMENGRGLEKYLNTLRAFSLVEGRSSDERLPVQGAKRSETEDLPSAGVIVMNANPFTLGHEYLVCKASEAFEHLFVIPVKDNGNIFPYEERLAMIKDGCGSLATVLEGSEYQISDITFPTYFLKDLSDASETQIRLDLDLFGRHIAPALGATVRFVGSEPLDPLTARYNELMKEILPGYGIEVVEIPRLTVSPFSPVPSFSPVPELVEGPVVRHAHQPGFVEGPFSASAVRQALTEGSFMTAAALTPPTTWPYLVAELMARALKMELDTPLKPGLVDRTSTGAHSDMDYDLMLGSIDVIRHSFAKRLVETLSLARDLESSDNQEDDKSLVAKTEGWTSSNSLINNKLQITAAESLSSLGKTIERDVLEYTNGVNTHRGAIFALGLASVAALEICAGTQLIDNKQNAQSEGAENATICLTNDQIFKTLHTSAIELSDKMVKLAEGIAGQKDSHGGRAVNEYAVKGALQMAQEGYSPLFEDWLPYYRSMQPVVRQAHQPDIQAHQPTERLQRTLLRIMSQLDDTCVIHRVGYDRAQKVKEEAKALLENFSLDDLKKMKAQYDAEGISPGGAADMLALTILVDSLLR